MTAEVVPLPVPKAKTKASRLPEDWEPSEESRKFCISLGLDPDWIAGEFRDYWISQPGKNAEKLNWEATYRNRCRQIAGWTLKEDHPARYLTPEEKKRKELRKSFPGYTKPL